MKEKIKGLSKAISIIAKIIKVFLIIGAVGIIIGASILPFVIKNITVVDDINVENDSFITISQKDELISIKVQDKIVVADYSVEEYKDLSKILSNDKKNTFMYYLEGTMFIGILMLVLLYFIMNYVEKLFKNMYLNDTPFILDNVNHIRKIAYLSICYIVAPLILGGIFEMITNIDLNINFSLLNVMLVLVLFVFAYVFEYGYSLENKKTKIRSN